MKLKKREEDGIVILELSGKIMGGPDAMLLNDHLHDLIESGHRKVVADLTHVDWMNSSGLGILISALTTIRNADGELKLANLTDRIHSLLKITKLQNVFDIYGTVQEAISSFSE